MSDIRTIVRQRLAASPVGAALLEREQRALEEEFEAQERQEHAALLVEAEALRADFERDAEPLNAREAAAQREYEGAARVLVKKTEALRAARGRPSRGARARGAVTPRGTCLLDVTRAWSAIEAFLAERRGIANRLQRDGYQARRDERDLGFAQVAVIHESNAEHFEHAVRRVAQLLQTECDQLAYRRVEDVQAEIARLRASIGLERLGELREQSRRVVDTAAVPLLPVRV
jgi:hypothetical protein